MLRSLVPLLKPQAGAAALAPLEQMRWFAAAAAAMKRLYVGNLSFETKAEDCAKLFGTYGAVQDVVIPLDHLGRSRGYAFVEMDEGGAAQATSSLNESTFMGRTIFISEARPREERPDRGFGGRGRRRGGSGGGGYGQRERQHDYDSSGADAGGGSSSRF